MTILRPYVKFLPSYFTNVLYVTNVGGINGISTSYEAYVVEKPAKLLHSHIY